MDVPPQLELLSPEEWPELIELLSKFTGPEATSDLFAFMMSPAGVAAMANPATFIHQAGQRFGTVWDIRGDPGEGEIEEFILGGLKAIRTITSRELHDARTLRSPCGAEMLAFLERAKTSQGFEAVVGCFRDTSASTLWSQGTLRGMLSLLRVTAGDLPGPLEQRVQELVRGIGDAGERWYKPLLQVALRIERLMRGQAGAAVPATLGNVVGQCRDLWRQAGPSSALDLDARLIRNADGHREVEVNVAAEEIRFVNRHGDNEPPEVLGPWREGQLHAFADDFLDRCWIMSLAYARFIVVELCRSLDDQGWQRPR